MQTDSIENKISTFVNDYLANEQKYNDCSITQNELQYDKCIIAYQLDTLILTKHNNNEKSRSRIKERNAVMLQLNVKKTQFNDSVKVGEKLSTGAPVDKSTFTIRSFYKEHFSTPKKTTELVKSVDKIDWKQKHDYLKEQLRIFIDKYETLEQKYRELKEKTSLLD